MNSQDRDLVLRKAVNRLNLCFLSQLLIDILCKELSGQDLSDKVAIFSAAAVYCFQLKNPKILS